MESNKIYPTKHLMEIEIALDEYPKFNGIWHGTKVFSFYCLNKQVSGDKIVLSIRAMRINEFIDLLNYHKIKWSLKEN